MISNIPIRYNPENHRLFVAPDWYISFNVDIAAIRYETSYNVWEIGKPPEFALEVASPSTFQRDIYEKPGLYARIGIQEYWMFDPTGGRLYGQPLAGFRLANGEYEPIEIALNEHGRGKRVQRGAEAEAVFAGEGEAVRTGVHSARDGAGG